jgi:hypothetical protein
VLYVVTTGILVLVCLLLLSRQATHDERVLHCERGSKHTSIARREESKHDRGMYAYINIEARAVSSREEGGYTVRSRNYVANEDQKNRDVRNAGHHP